MTTDVLASALGRQEHGRPGVSLAFLLSGSDVEPRRMTTLTANSKKARERAETSFSKMQTQSMALNRILSEQDAVSQARDVKTARLKELRLEKEADDIAAAAAAPVAKRKGPR